MSTKLVPAIVELFNAPDTVKILATVDTHGNPHAAVRESLHLADDGTIHVLELFETSNTERNLTNALWFEHRVAILLFGKDGRQIQINGKPLKNHISGPLFLRHYT
ncbi:MAG: pyridoxamine 5'-phosphate oxidase family protein, partial [Candidatus Accumulibacter sp.]|nr:pyridoxamine 5'-phosphate oxidase family protein [Accumulibacter sp.]